MSKSAHEIWKQKIDENLTNEEYKDLLIKEGVIIEQSKEEIRDMFMNKVKVPENINELFKKSHDNFSTKWWKENPEKCKHENIKREDGLDECLDCGVRNY